jgi:hypothetical protein
LVTVPTPVLVRPAILSRRVLARAAEHTRTAA